MVKKSVPLSALRDRIPVSLPPAKLQLRLSPAVVQTASVHEVALPFVVDAFFQTGVMDEFPESVAHLINRHSPAVLRAKMALAQVRPSVICVISRPTTMVIWHFFAGRVQPTHHSTPPGACCIEARHLHQRRPRDPSIRERRSRWYFYCGRSKAIGCSDAHGIDAHSGCCVATGVIIINHTSIHPFILSFTHLFICLSLSLTHTHTYTHTHTSFDCCGIRVRCRGYRRSPPFPGCVGTMSQRVAQR
jgi:hypothetical protein